MSTKGNGCPALAQTSTPSTLDTLLLTDGQDKYPLGSHLEILEDPSGQLTTDEVSSLEYNSQFILNTVDVPNFSYTDSVYWVRFRLDNEAHRFNEWLLELGFANMQYVDLYSPLPDSKGFIVKQTGAAKPVSTRDVLNPNIVFTISIPAPSQQTYYMRFQIAASMTLPLTIWTEKAFSVLSQWAQMLYWFFFGAIIALLVYHLFLLITLRETMYLLFIILLASAFVLVLSYSGYLEVMEILYIEHILFVIRLNLGDQRRQPRLIDADGEPVKLFIRPGETVIRTNVYYLGTVKVNLIGYWRKSLAKPLWVMTTLEPKRALEIYQKRMKIEQTFRDCKDLLHLSKLMNKQQRHLEQMIALTLIAYTVGLWVGEALRDVTYAKLKPNQLPDTLLGATTIDTSQHPKWLLYSGLFVLLKQKLRISQNEFDQVAQISAKAFASLIYGNVRTFV